VIRSRHGERSAASRCEKKLPSLRAKRGSPEPEFAAMDGRASLAMTRYFALAVTGFFWLAA